MIFQTNMNNQVNKFLQSSKGKYFMWNITNVKVILTAKKNTQAEGDVCTIIIKYIVFATNKSINTFQAETEGWY